MSKSSKMPSKLTVVPFLEFLCLVNFFDKKSGVNGIAHPCNLGTSNICFLYLSCDSYLNAQEV